MPHEHAPHEEAEHAAHHSQDPFDKRVAMTMVVIAALLAAVRVLGHRSHNDTLSYQIEANVHHTQESDQWSYFQAKKNRQYLYESQADLLTLLAPGDGKDLPADADLLAVAAVKEEAKPAPKKKKKGGLSEEGKQQVEELIKKKELSREAAVRIVTWKEQAKQYRREADAIEANAKLQQEEAKNYQKKSEHKHHQSAFFDLGELGVELALVLSSVAILTKRPPFWYGGMAVGALGLVVVAIGFFVH